MADETRYCRRIESHVYFDPIEDSGRVFVVCKHYDVGDCSLVPNFKTRCLVNLTVKREEKSRLEKLNL